MPTNELLPQGLVDNLIAAGYTPRTAEEWIISAIDYLHQNAIVPGGGGTGDVVGPASSTGDNIAVYNGATGKIIKDGGAAIAALITASGAATLTNKRITPRVQTVASAATVTPNADADDEVVVTAQGAAIQFLNPSGTPTQGQAIIIRLKDNGTGRAITYDTQYRAIGVTLPTTTVANKTIYLGMIFNSTDTKWDVTGVSEEA